MINFRTCALALAVAIAPAAAITPAFAQDVVQISAASQSGEFERRSKRLQGDWAFEQRDGKTFIVLSEDFRAARGPDLKIFLSPLAYGEVTGTTAVNGAINIGELKKTRGVQEYELPADINVADYQSILVHCEQFAVLWGGSDL